MTPTRAPLYPERIEILEDRIAPAGVVTILLNKADVSLVGDGADNDVTLTATGTGAYFLTGNNGTMIALGNNPNATVQGIDVILGNLSVALGGGSDSFTLNGVTLPHNLTLTDLAGNNTVTVSGTTNIGGKVSLKFGPGKDLIQGAPTSFHVGGDLLISGGDGNNDYEVNGNAISIGGNLTVTGGVNGDILLLKSKTLTIGKNVSLAPGAGQGDMELSPTSALTIGGGVTLKGSLAPGAGAILNLGGNDLLTIGKGITFTGSASSDLLELGGNDLEIHGAVSLSGGGDTKQIILGAGHGSILGALNVNAAKGKALLTGSSGIAITGKTTITGGPAGTFIDLGGPIDFGGGLAISDATTAANANVFVRLSGSGGGMIIGGSLSVKIVKPATNLGKFTLQGLLLAGPASIVTGAGNDTVTIDQVESYGTFTLDTGAGTDTVNIERSQQANLTHFAKAVVIKLGAGDDHLNIGSAMAGDGTGFLSPVASLFDGGPGVDMIAIDPQTAFLKPAVLIGF